MKQNPNAFFFSHAVGCFNLEDEMKVFNEELINLSLKLYWIYKEIKTKEGDVQFENESFSDW